MVPPSSAADPVAVCLATWRWLERAIVGLDLCPFAAGPLAAGRVRLAVELSDDPRALLVRLDEELSELVGVAASEVETSLLIHPGCLLDFAEFNDFFAAIEELLALREAVGVIQVVGFHPDYCFADAPDDDPANFTNRSPYPMLHLLREASVTQAVAGPVDVAAIPPRNAATLRALERAELEALRSK